MKKWADRGRKKKKEFFEIQKREREETE